jgi:hypothetical protein
MGLQHNTQNMSEIPLNTRKKCCFTHNIHTLRLSVGGRTDGRTDGCTENIYSIFRDKLSLRGEHELNNLWGTNEILSLSMMCIQC